MVLPISAGGGGQLSPRPHASGGERVDVGGGDAGGKWYLAVLPASASASFQNAAISESGGMVGRCSGWVGGTRGQRFVALALG